MRVVNNKKILLKIVMLYFHSPDLTDWKESMVPFMYPITRKRKNNHPKQRSTKNFFPISKPVITPLIAPRDN